ARPERSLVTMAIVAAQHASRFGGPRSHRLAPGVGHNMPQEVPQVFADAVMELVRGRVGFATTDSA
ncbi:MAG: hypothetical protein ABL895_21540, partial [Cyclobacteriaceae bacterium]